MLELATLPLLPLWLYLWWHLLFCALLFNNSSRSCFSFFSDLIFSSTVLHFAWLHKRCIHPLHSLWMGFFPNIVYFGSPNIVFLRLFYRPSFLTQSTCYQPGMSPQLPPFLLSVFILLPLLPPFPHLYYHHPSLTPASLSNTSILSPERWTKTREKIVWIFSFSWKGAEPI